MKNFLIICIFYYSVVCAVKEDKKKWRYQAPVSACPGDKITTKFMYEDPSIKFMNLAGVTWFYEIDKSYRSFSLVCYYSKENGLEFYPDSPYSQRVKWINNTINFEFENLFPNDTGLYDVQFTVFNFGDFEAIDSNGTLQLTIDDPCVREKIVEDECTEMTCVTLDSNPVYSWTGEGAEGQTTAVVTVCPKVQTNYTCCVDSEKTKCMQFQANAGNKGDKSSNTAIVAGLAVAILIMLIVIIAITVAILILKRKKEGDSDYLIKQKQMMYKKQMLMY